MNNRSNPAKHSLATRFRPRPQEILLATPKSRIRPNPPPFNHLIFSTRYKKPPSPPVLTYNIPFAFPSPAKAPTRRGSVSRLPALSVPNVSRAKPRTEWCRAKPRGNGAQPCLLISTCHTRSETHESREVIPHRTLTSSLRVANYPERNWGAYQARLRRAYLIE